MRDGLFTKMGPRLCNSTYLPRLFTVSLRNSIGRRLPVRLCNGTVNDLCKMVEIPTGNSNCGNFNLYLDNKSRGNASQLEAMSHFPQPPTVTSTYFPRLFHSLHAQPYKQAFAYGAMRCDCRSPWKMVKIPTGNYYCGNFNLYLDKKNRRVMPAKCRPCLIPHRNGGLGLCSSRVLTYTSRVRMAVTI